MRSSLPVVLVMLIAASPVLAAWNPAGVDLTRPRLLFRSGDLAVLQQRVEREPYRTVVAALLTRSHAADNLAVDDHSIGAERIKARSAKNLAFLYALDRTLQDGAVIPFPTPEDRAAVGQRVQDLLMNMYTRCRLAVPAPLGGWDRDISTSEELIQYATAYDTLRGAGYELGADDATIVANLAALAGELYDNYAHPETASNFSLLHQNNHRSKSGAALVVAGIALAEYTPAPGTDPTDTHEPTRWIEYGLDQVDLILRYALVTGDGAYGEGPFYFRYTAQNILPFARAWDRLVDGRAWDVGGLEIPSLWRHPLFARSQRWMLDMTLPDGSLAPTDDGNPGRSYYFGVAPTDAATAAAYAWRWANAPAPFETDGNVDLGADAIVAYDDTVVPAPPTSAGAAFYVEGGNAVFRSDWSTGAVQAVVVGEHDTASEFGRDRSGRGVAPESHEHADPGSFLLHGFGERLALDPGYLDFGARMMVNQPQHHNLILVDGHGPVDYLVASLQWQQRDLNDRPPADGQATLSDTLDAGFVDAVRVTSRYGQPAERAAVVNRRFVFADRRYLVIADDVQGPRAPAATFTWLLHGNGGGDSGGSFDLLSDGARWSRPAARLDSAIAFAQGAPTFVTDTAVHEAPGGQQRTHTVLQTQVTGSHIRSLQFAYPSPADQSPPDSATLQLAQGTALVLVDAASDRRVVGWYRDAAAATVSTPPGFQPITSDGALVVIDTHSDGQLRFAWSEPARTLKYNQLQMTTATPGSLGMQLEGERAELVANTPDPTVQIANLPFQPRTADGACAMNIAGQIVTVHLNRERRFTLRSDASNAIPAADPGPDQRVAAGTTVTLDGSASCDADGDALSPHWELTSAPAGSAWALESADTWQPQLHADRVGPFRVHLVVTDSHGAASRPVEVLVIAGDQCADGVDNDLDGLIDSDDRDCDTGFTAPASACGGDCDDTDTVTVSELVRCVNIALDRLVLSSCGACDADGDGRVLVNELVGGVNSLLHGCAH